MRAFRPADLLLVGLLAAGGIVSALTPSLEGTVRFVLALLMVSVLPGYAATAVLFEHESLRTGTLVAMTLGLSLSIAAVGGVVLHLTPWGLVTETWAVLLGGSTLLLSAIALARWASVRPRPPRPAVSWSRPAAGSVMAVVLLGVSVAITAGAIGVAQSGVRAQPRDPFTELWLVPREFAGEVVLGVRNMEGTALRGRLTVTSGTETLADFPDLDLAPEVSFERTLRYDPEAAPDRIVARFFRDDAPDVAYRSVELWLT